MSYDFIIHCLEIIVNLFVCVHGGVLFDFLVGSLRLF